MKVEKLKYTSEGYLIVSELYTCPFWEKSSIPSYSNCDNDCFFCKYSDFRTKEFMDKVEGVPKIGEWCSVCHNEKNRIEITNKEDKNED